jgi:hypothetical protein
MAEHTGNIRVVEEAKADRDQQRRQPQPDERSGGGEAADPAITR